MSAVGSAIAELRESRDLSQNKFSRELDLTVVSVFRYETGDMEPGVKVLVKLALMALGESDTAHLAPVFARSIAASLSVPERSVNLFLRDAMKG